jgi:hypothetical protein
MSTSVRPNAAAAAFWRLITLWIFICAGVNLGAAGAAEPKAANPATTVPTVLMMEGILMVSGGIPSFPFLISLFSFSLSLETCSDAEEAKTSLAVE